MVGVTFMQLASNYIKACCREPWCACDTCSNERMNEWTNVGMYSAGNNWAELQGRGVAWFGLAVTDSF